MAAVPDCEGYTYLSKHVLSGGVVDKKAEKKIGKALIQAVQKAVQKTKGLKWKKPTGKQTGFAISIAVKLAQKQKGKGSEVQAQATVDVRLVPSQVKVLLLTASPKKLPLKSASASDVGDGAQALVQDLVDTLMKKKVVKTLQKKAAELGKS